MTCKKLCRKSMLHMALHSCRSFVVLFGNLRSVLCLGRSNLLFSSVYLTVVNDGNGSMLSCLYYAGEKFLDLTTIRSIRIWKKSTVKNRVGYLLTGQLAMPVTHGEIIGNAQPRFPKTSEHGCKNVKSHESGGLQYTYN